MSLFSTMRTSVSGMAAQSNALSTIGDNIANSATTGYKAANAQFETVLGQNSTGSYESGGVQTDIRYGIATQGTLVTTTSATDLAVNGNGFFVVNKNGGDGTYLTRAGSFVPDSNGNLVNAAGYQLMGYQIGADGTVGSTLTNINISSGSLQVAASTAGTLTANLPSTAAAATGHVPNDNQADSTYSNKTSMTVYDSLGKAEILDVYFTKTSSNTWSADVYRQSDATNGGFSYGTAGTAPLVHQSMTFSPSDGSLATPTTGSLSIPLSTTPPQTVKVDISGMTQLATDFGVTTAKANGNAPSKLDHVTVGKDGTLTEVYASGVQVNSYEIPLATVASTNNLTPLSGNVYQTSNTSGLMVLSKATTNGTGSINADTLEQSTVDLASELTNMIQAQRSYEANSKVLQAGSDLLGVLNRLSTN